VETQDYQAENSFANFNVAGALKANIQTRGFKTPSPIQDQVIPRGLQGKNMIGIADTGTGKTLAFAIPVINKLIQDRNSKALVVAPTRELAMQILEECHTLLRGTGIRTVLLIGGTNIRPQFQKLNGRPSLVIGTPGRIKDHLGQGSLDLSGFNLVVLDEVDRMLDMGFVRDMRVILGQLATQRQSFFFSATIDTKSRALIDEFAKDAVLVNIKSGETSDLVEQDVVSYHSPEDKIQKLHSVLTGDKKVLIFDDTRRATERLSKALQQGGYKADSIHGGKSQGQRKRALANFRANQIDVLVATDVAARGIDVIDITHVINYSTPQSYSDYTHRVGRAGRAGQKGYALTFVQASFRN